MMNLLIDRLQGKVEAALATFDFAIVTVVQKWQQCWLELKARRAFKSKTNIVCSVPELKGLVLFSGFLWLNREVSFGYWLVNQILPQLLSLPSEQQAQYSLNYEISAARRYLADFSFQLGHLSEAEEQLRVLMAECGADSLLPKRIYLYRLLEIAKQTGDLLQAITWQRELVLLHQTQMADSNISRRVLEAELLKMESDFAELSQNQQ